MEAGQSPNTFWSLTYREIGAVLKGVIARRTREHEERIWSAWHIEAFHRMKRLPSLSKALSRKPRRQSVDEQMAIAMRWNAHMNRVAKRKGADG